MSIIDFNSDGAVLSDQMWFLIDYLQSYQAICVFLHMPFHLLSCVKSEDISEFDQGISIVFH